MSTTPALESAAWCFFAALTLAAFLCIQPTVTSAQSPQILTERIAEEEEFILDLEGELPEFKRIIANSRKYSSEEVENARLQLAERQATIIEARKTIAKLRAKSPTTKRVKIDPAGSVTARDSKTGNSKRGEVANLCGEAIRFVAPKVSLYRFPSGINPRKILPPLAKHYLELLLEHERGFVRHLLACNQEWDPALANNWASDYSAFVDRFGFLETRFVLGWVSDYTKQEKSKLDRVALKDVETIRLMEIEEDKLYRKYRVFWDRARKAVDGYRYAADAGTRLSIFQAQEMANKARLEYEAFHRKRVLLDQKKNNVLAELRAERMVRALGIIRTEIPEAEFSLHERSEFMMEQPGKTSLRKYLLGNSGWKIFQRESSRRVKAGYRGIK